MKFKLAQRVKKLTDPTVRETLKLASRPTIIYLAGGVPNPNLFPLKKIKEYSQKILKTQGSQVLQYSQTAGLPETRKQIALYLEQKWQKKIKPEEVMITTGSQQALDLIG